MIEEVQGNLLEAEVDALVNTVNTVGVMGKGIALQFRRAYPDNFRAYAAACKSDSVRLGEVFVHPTGAYTGPRYIINFPTKRHWKSKARLKDIEVGLASLRQTLLDLNVSSVAVPPLGCGNGGLEWSRVYPLIRQYLGDLEDMHVLVYAPAGAPSPDSMPVRTKRPTMTRPRAALLLAFERYIKRSVGSGQSEDYKLSIVEAQKVAYFLQVAGWPGGWDFAPSYFGPYSQVIDQFISLVEGHFIAGYGDGSSGSRATLTLDSVALAGAHELLDGDSEFEAALARFEGIVDGFEFPYGIELLSTVDYVVRQHESCPPVEDVISAIGSWSNRKARLFKEKQAASAYEHLISVGAV